jgi:hypothetical protein
MTEKNKKKETMLILLMTIISYWYNPLDEASLALKLFVNYILTHKFYLIFYYHLQIGMLQKNNKIKIKNKEQF